MTETQLKDRVMKRLRSMGGLWWKTHGGAYSVPGIFDIIGCYKGRFIAIELKRPGAYKSAKDGLTEAQWRFNSQVKANGGEALVVDDEEWLFEILGTIGEKC